MRYAEISGYFFYTMAKDPAFLFYTNDFSSGTQFFTDEQLGKFLRLLMAQHQHGHLSEKQVLIICKSHNEDTQEILRKFEKDEDGFFYNLRLENEINKRKDFSKSRSDNRLGKIKPKKKTSKSYVKHMENENKDVNRNKEKKEIEIIDIDFQNFWDLYDKKVGDKEKIKSKFISLKPDEKKKIFEHLPNYIMSTPDKKFRKDPATYLNNKSWNDEIIIPTYKNRNNERIYTPEDFQD